MALALNTPRRVLEEDVFGARESWIDNALRVLRPIHDHYFRVRSYHIENIPKTGAAIIAGNHSGTLPFDAVMMAVDVFDRVCRPIRPIVDRFVPTMPFVSTWLARLGGVAGTHGNVRWLLEHGELIMIFPEGTTGISKPFSRRYQIADWRVGFAELALRHRVPIVPVATIGPEEQMPQIGRITKGARLIGAPYIPITLTPIPLPVRYHIHYGEPIEPGDGDPDDAVAVLELASRVKTAVEALIDEGLRGRPGVFE